MEDNTRTRKRRDPRVEAMPYPYKAWLALSSDPDNTRFPDWQELDQVIWKELGLPFADSYFIRSYSKQLLDQVDLHAHPEILSAHPHDTMHTWGDFLLGREKSFDRVDAEAHLRILQQLGSKPRVWVDHSMFVGNMIHFHRYGSMPAFTDTSGHVYPNPLYSLDLAHEAGVRYLWDGTITPIIGQDRPISLWRIHRERAATWSKALSNYLLHIAAAILGVGKSFRAQFPPNDGYRPMRFEDGRWLYVFTRHGQWAKADIDGLGDLLSTERINALVRSGGMGIIYTHLGKRPVDRMPDPVHIPPRTKAALQHVKERFEKRELMVSSTSELLDYAVLRDNIRVDVKGKTIEFVADGIAYTSIGAAEVAGKSFTIRGNGQHRWQVRGTTEELRPRIEPHGRRFTLHFDPA